jgi:hypothetical protein
MTVAGTHRTRGGLTRRVAGRTLLWAGPLGIAASALLLLAAAPWFRHGPGVPTAGDERAWGALWAALALTGTGCLTGALAGATWLVLALRAGRRPTPLEWVRTAVGLLLGVGFLIVFMGW